MQRRSNLMVLLGIAFFLIGGAIVFLIANDNGDDGGGGGSGGEDLDVVVAAVDIPAGTLGKDAVANKLVKIEKRPAAIALQSLTNEAQLNNATIAAEIAAGQPILNSQVTTDTIRSVAVPKGFEAIAISTDFISGGAGYIDPGDRINVYAVIADCKAEAGANGTTPPCPYSTPRDELLLTNVLVVDIDIQQAPNRGTNPPADTSAGNTVSRAETADQVVMLLAVATSDAEKLIYQTEFQRIYVTITADKAPPAGPTPGRDFATILDVEADKAFRDSN